ANVFDFGNKVPVAAAYGWTPTTFQGLADHVWLAALLISPCQVHVDSRVFWVDPDSFLKIRNRLSILPQAKKLIPQAEEEHCVVWLLVQQLFQCLTAVFPHPALLLPNGSGPLPVVPHCTRGERLAPATLDTS